MKDHEHLDAIYRDLSPEDIPWNMEHPPAALVELCGSGWVKPGRAVDLGCGAGRYAVWMAEQGFEMTGVDLSPRAVELAEELAKTRSVVCRFIAADLTGELPDLGGSFAFAYDWEVLHHVFPEHRPAYAENVHRLLEPGGRYLSVCFSERDPFAGGTGKYRETRLGTRLYFSSEEELRELFEPWFHVHELTTVEIEGKHAPHLAVKALLIRR